MACVKHGHKKTEFLVSKETVVLRRWERSKQKFRKLSKSFTVVIQPLSSRLIKTNFCIRKLERICNGKIPNANEIKKLISEYDEGFAITKQTALEQRSAN